MPRKIIEAEFIYLSAGDTLRREQDNVNHTTGGGLVPLALSLSLDRTGHLLHLKMKTASPDHQGRQHTA